MLPGEEFGRRLPVPLFSTRPLGSKSGLQFGQRGRVFLHGPLLQHIGLVESTIYPDRAKHFVRKIESTRRYEVVPQGLRAMSALLVLRDKVIKPLLTAACQLKRGPKAKSCTTLDWHYQTLRRVMEPGVEVRKRLGFSQSEGELNRRRFHCCCSTTAETIRIIRWRDFCGASLLY
jgi:hypothetical protein